jgi:2-polyprenyl-6-methoxyphenol hydroxylase-like FAD-dependent oxidoreductase
VSDVHYLARALAAYYASGDLAPLQNYGATALARVWHSMRTSSYLTHLLHRFPGSSEFDQRMQEAELDLLLVSPAAQAALAEAYAGAPRPLYHARPLFDPQRPQFVTCRLRAARPLPTLQTSRDQAPPTRSPSCSRPSRTVCPPWSSPPV